MVQQTAKVPGSETDAKVQFLGPEIVKLIQQRFWAIYGPRNLHYDQENLKPAEVFCLWSDLESCHYLTHI